MRTVPVNQSAGPLLEGCEPILLISILNFFHSFLFGFYLLARLTTPGVLGGTGSHSRPHPPAGGWRRRPPGRTIRQESRSLYKTFGSVPRCPPRLRCCAVPSLPRPPR